MTSTDRKTENWHLFNDMIRLLSQGWTAREAIGAMSGFGNSDYMGPRYTHLARSVFRQTNLALLAWAHVGARTQEQRIADLTALRDLEEKKCVTIKQIAQNLRKRQSSSNSSATTTTQV